MTSSITAQIAEVEREIAMRRRVYPSQVMRGKMRQSEVDLRISLMEDVLATLRQLQQQQRGAT
jgi:hypothetical protein